jgi:hypothetical protein
MNAEARSTSFRTKRVTGYNTTHSRELEEENDSGDGEGKVKTKLLSMWNNMKYGKFILLKYSITISSCLLSKWNLGFLTRTGRHFSRVRK